MGFDLINLSGHEVGMDYIMFFGKKIKLKEGLKRWLRAEKLSLFFRRAELGSQYLGRVAHHLLGIPVSDIRLWLP